MYCLDLTRIDKNDDLGICLNIKKNISYLINLIRKPSVKNKPLSKTSNLLELTGLDAITSFSPFRYNFFFFQLNIFSEKGKNLEWEKSAQIYLLLILEGYHSHLM